MHNLVNFTLQLEVLQNKLDYEEENLNYSNKSFKFAISTNPKSSHAKKYFNLNTALEQVKITKQRLVEIKRKREFRELHRVAKNVPSLMAQRPDWGVTGDYRASSFRSHSQSRQSRKWRGVAEASHRVSEIKESNEGGRLMSP